MTFECFGLVIHGYSAEEAIERIKWINAQGKPAIVVTANAEILLEAKRDPRYWNVLRGADMRLVDSVGLQLIGRLSGNSPHRVPGVDLALRLLEEAAERDWRVALVGGGKGVAERASWELRKRWPHMVIQAEEGGRVAADGMSDDAGQEALQRLMQFGPQLILVAFGHPKQESWIAKNIATWPSALVAMGIGGTLDYISGMKKRAPSWMQKLGLEWLYRFINEPSRIGRILNAVFVFPVVALIDARQRTKHIDKDPKKVV